MKFNERDVKKDLQTIIDDYKPEIIFWSALSSHINGEGEYVNIQYGHELIRDIKTSSIKIAGGLQPTAEPLEVFERFPCISLAYEALKKRGTHPAVLNVANEQAVYRFLNNEITFVEIPIIIEQACEKHDCIMQPSLEDLIYIENWTIDFVKSFKGKN